MKKCLKLFCAVLVALFVLQAAVAVDAAPKKRERPKDERKPARFARVAVLPVINLQEDIDYANTIVFQKALEVFQYPDYEIYDSDRLYQALEEVNYYEAGKKEVTEEMLRTVMEKAGLDMIVVFKLNELSQNVAPSYGGRGEDMDELRLDMNIMVIYNWREKIIDRRVNEKKTMEYGFVMKKNWKLEEYSRAVNIQLERIASLGKK